MSRAQGSITQKFLRKIWGTVIITALGLIMSFIISPRAVIMTVPQILREKFCVMLPRALLM